MADDIVTRLRAAALSGDLTLGQSLDCALVADEIERLRLIINAYAAAADGIVLNWNQDRFGNWTAFDAAHHALLKEARRG